MNPHFTYISCNCIVLASVLTFHFNMNRDVQAGFEILTAVVMKPPFFWGVTPCSPLEA
jgi:hypothetical protein